MENISLIQKSLLLCLYYTNVRKEILYFHLLTRLGMITSPYHELEVLKNINLISFSFDDVTGTYNNIVFSSQTIKYLESLNLNDFFDKLRISYQYIDILEKIIRDGIERK